VLRTTVDVVHTLTASIQTEALTAAAGPVTMEMDSTASVNTYRRNAKLVTVGAQKPPPNPLTPTPQYWT